LAVESQHALDSVWKTSGRRRIATLAWAVWGRVDDAAAVHRPDVKVISRA
jgi:hypothetical protein